MIAVIASFFLFLEPIPFVSEQKEDLKSQFEIAYQIVNTYIRQGDFEHGREQSERLTVLAALIGQPEYMIKGLYKQGFALRGLALEHASNKLFVEARSRIREAVQLYEKSGLSDPQLKARLFFHAAMCEIDDPEGCKTEGALKAQEAVRLFKELGEIAYYKRSLICLARVQVMLGQQKKAEEIISLLKKESGANWIKMRLDYIEAEIAASRGDFEQAYIYARLGKAQAEQMHEKCYTKRFERLITVLNEKTPFFFSKTEQAHLLEPYSEDERKAIHKDLHIVEGICLNEQKAQEKPYYLATCGAHGSRKSTILERFLAKEKKDNAVYLDPDQRALKFMANTYHARSLNALTIAITSDYREAQKRAYEKWRPASNFITMTLLEKALSNRYNVAHGTTSTNDYVEAVYKKLKERNYEIILLLCSTNDDCKRQAIQYRNDEQRFYLSHPKEEVVKERLYPQKMLTYFTYADQLYLFWSDDLFTEERLAAVLTRGKCEIKDRPSYEAFVKKYEEDRALLALEDKNLYSWEQLLNIWENERS